MNFYNEHDPNAAAWLRELIARDLIPAGDVDERSIIDIQPHELKKYTSCHFFAGIGLWALALRLAGWPDDRPVWTASLPCQPFSEAGKGEGADDARHLWPVFHRLVTVERPERIFGEQVAAAIGYDWLDGISANLEADGYTVGAAVLGAHSVGAPHIRRRLYWMADTEDADRWSKQQPRSARSGRDGLAGSGEPHGLADSEREGLQGHAGDVGDGSEPGRHDPVEAGSASEGGTALHGLGNTEGGELGIVGNAAQPRSGGHVYSASESNRLADASSGRREMESINIGSGNTTSGFRETDFHRSGGTSDGMGIPNSHGRQPGQQPGAGKRYRDTIEPASCWAGRVIECRDGKSRKIPIESDFFPLAHDGQYLVPGMARRRTVRPALLKGSGNAIVPQVAAIFIETCEEILNK